MILVLSPSKTQDFSQPLPRLDYTLPALAKESLALVKELKRLSAGELERLMNISPKLAALNTERYREFQPEFTPENARPAMLAFKGDVYDGLKAEAFTPKDTEFAQAHLRILSGLYGVLKPLDLIQPYRLEMKTKLKNARGKDLYAFWDSRITGELNAALTACGSDALINLASEEYFKSVQPKALKGTVITPVFKEKQGRAYKVIGLFAKKARGEMAGYAIRKRLATPEKLKHFSGMGYAFEPALSTERTWVFAR